MNAIADIPADVPDAVRQAISTAVNAEAQAHRQVAWSEALTVLIVFSQLGNAESLDCGMTVLDGGKPGSAVALLRRAVDGRLPRLAAGATYVGTATLAGALVLLDAVPSAEAMGRDPLDVREHHADLVATGRAAQFRVVTGAMASGWRWEVCRARHHPGITIELFAPGEQRPGVEHELSAAITALNTRLIQKTRAGGL